LIAWITSRIRPGSWSDTGGQATIRYDETKVSLVVHQTTDVHEQVADLFAALRRHLE
jgi:hypothetical protein